MGLSQGEEFFINSHFNNLFMNSSMSMLGVIVMIALVGTTLSITPILIQQSAGILGGQGGRHTSGKLGVPMATSGNNLYMAWPNNDTGHWNVFFAKSTGGGKTLKTMMISAPNKGNTIHQDTQISASGSNVYVTWWTNKTGTLMPVFKASNDNGDTFGKTMTLNSTSAP
jgi:hypothetical protein